MKIEHQHNIKFFLLWKYIKKQAELEDLMKMVGEVMANWTPTQPRLTPTKDMEYYNQFFHEVWCNVVKCSVV